MTFEENNELVETICQYIEEDSFCPMGIVIEETKREYGIRLLKVLAVELREKFKHAG